MFTHRCSACDRTQLIFESQGIRATRGDGGIDFTFVCWCGAEQTHLLEDLPPLESLVSA